MGPPRAVLSTPTGSGCAHLGLLPWHITFHQRVAFSLVKLGLNLEPSVGPLRAPAPHPPTPNFEKRTKAQFSHRSIGNCWLLQKRKKMAWFVLRCFNTTALELSDSVSVQLMVLRNHPIPRSCCEEKPRPQPFAQNITAQAVTRALPSIPTCLARFVIPWPHAVEKALPYRLRFSSPLLPAKWGQNVCGEIDWTWSTETGTAAL